MSQNRRSFLKFVLGAGAGIAASPVVFKLADDSTIWTQNWSWIPRNPKGANSYELTTSKLCPSACGLKVRLVGGQPVRALPDPNHPLGGGLSALAAAEVQLMYSPARVKHPLKKTSDGAYVRISWDEAVDTLTAKLREAGSGVAAISGDETGSSMDVLSAFLAGRGSDNFYLMPSEAQAASRAWSLMGGKGQTGYNLEDADFVLAIGANALESWGTFIRNRRLFAAQRPHGAAPKNTFVYAGPVQTGNAAVADQWIAIKPGRETSLALAIAAQLAQRGHSINSPDAAAFKNMLFASAEKELAAAGVDPATLKSLVDALARARRPVVLVGSEFGQGSGAALVMAGLAVNFLLGGEAVKDLPVAAPVMSAAKTRTELYEKDLVSYFAHGARPKVALFYEANPAYALPGAKKVAAAIGEIPFKASFSAFMDETASLCDLVLPMPLGLERLDDIHNPYGCGKAIYALSRKTMEPYANARHGMDVLLGISAALGSPLAPSYESVLKARASAIGADWASLSRGVPFESNSTHPIGQIAISTSLLMAASQQKSATAGLNLAPIQKIAMGTAQTGIPPFNVKTIKGNELRGKEMSVIMSRKTAESRGKLKDGDLVALSAAGNEIRARVHLYEGIAPDTIGVFTGFGHTALDEFSRNKGANIAELFITEEEAETGLSVWHQTGVSVTKA